jgi:Xaa-Pro dipeptidase
VDLQAIQQALREAHLDGWLFYDHHHRDPIAYRILGISPLPCTRRWYYLIPASGEPAKLVHRIEKGVLQGLPGIHYEYASWQEQREKLRAILAGSNDVAMQYSVLNDIPAVGLVDAGTVELVRSCGVEVLSSADLVQRFEARWSPEQLEMHLAAGEIVHAAVRAAFAMIRDATAERRVVGEYDVQQEILRVLEAGGVTAQEPPIVAVNANSSDPHYSPTPASSTPIRPGDWVLLDVFGKKSQPGSVYFDITWTGFVGHEVPPRHREMFDIVREARDTALSLVQQSCRRGHALCGYEVDDAARAVIARRGYADCFLHRTGHSLGEDVHGGGANMDNFETHDGRRIMACTGFTIEPGIYLTDFGVRSEVDVYVEESDARVTGEIQQSVVPILAGLR